MKKFLYLVLVVLSVASCSSKSTEKADEVAQIETDGQTEVTVAPQTADGKVLELDNPALLAPGVKVEQLTIVDFNAVWCGPCRQLAPVLEEAAAKYAGKATFISVDVDKYGDLMEAYNLGNSIPVVLFLKPDGTKEHYVGTGDLLPSDKFFALIDEKLK